jgi:hypothetical protein
LKQVTRFDLSDGRDDRRSVPSVVPLLRNERLSNERLSNERPSSNVLESEDEFRVSLDEGQLPDPLAPVSDDRDSLSAAVFGQLRDK